MAYILNNLTLPNPKRFTRRIIEIGTENITIGGKTTKRIQNRKEQFILEFKNLTLSQADSILAIYLLNQVVTFSNDDTSLLIDDTNVLVDVDDRFYNKAGNSYRKDFNLILTEVI